MPSIKIDPEEGSIIPAISFDKVDFPEPILPTTATFWPAGILNETLFIVGCLVSSKLKETFLNSISPLSEDLLMGDRFEALLKLFPISLDKFL